MNLRQLLNVVYAFLMKGRDANEKEALDSLIYEKRYEDMNEFERGRFRRKIEAMRTGAYYSQPALVASMGMPQGRRRPT